MYTMLILKKKRERRNKNEAIADEGYSWEKRLSWNK